MARRVVRRRRQLGGVVAAGLACLGASARAGDDWVVLPDPDNPFYRYEAFGGADITSHSWSTWAGMTASLSGDVRVDGFRVRSAFGYGAYDYTSPRWNGVMRVPTAFEGRQTITDLMLGYQHAIGPWIIKLFAGGTSINHAISPFDNENDVQGAKRGVKVAVETWANFGNVAFLQTETSWTNVFETYGARARAGWRINPALSIGPEAAVNGNAVYDSGRVGAFARLEWSTGEISVSGGAAGDMSGVTGAYGSVGVMLRF